MLKVGQKAEVEMTGYSAEGLGVCRVEGCAVFVPNAIRGEICEISVTHVSRNSAHGKIERIIRSSPHRIPRACPAAKLCGGCQYHHMDYAEELSAKAQKVTDALTRIGGQSLPEQAAGVAPARRDGSQPSSPSGEAAGAALARSGEHCSPWEDEATGPGAGIRDQGSGIREGSEFRVQSSAPPVGGGVLDAPPSAAPRSDEATGNRQQATVQGTGNRELENGGTGPSAPLRCAQDDKNGSLSACRDGSQPSAFSGVTVRGEGVVPITGAVEQNAYRNKAQYPLAMKNGRPIAGFYKNRSHEVVPVKRCAILPAVFDQVKDLVLRWAEVDRVSIYDEHTGKGLLRHIYLRRAVVTGELMVCLVVNGDHLPRENRLIHALQREIPGLASVILSKNVRNTNVVLGDEFRTLWGRDWIEDELCGFRFRLSPRSFYQVNHDQAQRLYEKAVELAELHGTETVLDLYCGTGTITLALSRRAGKVIGVEVIAQAIEDARENAARNGVKNVEFFCADAGEAAQRFAARTTGSGRQPTGEEKERILPCAQNDRTGSVDVIVVDPPRKGLAPEVIDAMVTMAPARIVYVSCDPATLARDVKLLSEQGYALTHAEAFDLFPRTYHVETVVQLVRKNPNMTVSVTLNLEDADLTASEAKATYDQIKAYVLETFGLRVTSLQIAQTKRKLGLSIGEHYNLSQKENQVVPQCPPEKEAVILEALRHFQMM